MDFQKFPSINDWKTGSARHGFLAIVGPDDVFVLQEKVDGANIQLLFQPGKPLQVGRRTGWLREGENFFNVWDTLKAYKEDLSRLQAHVDETHETWRLFGEIYGPKIQRRIPYCDESRICLFDVTLESESVPVMPCPQTLASLLSRLVCRRQNAHDWFVFGSSPTRATATRG